MPTPSARPPAAATRVPVAPEPARSWSDSSKVIFAALPPEGVPASVRSTIEPGGPIEVAAFVANIPINMFPGSDVLTDGAVMLVERLFACPPNTATGATVFAPE
jgi:hypothetical protein